MFQSKCKESFFLCFIFQYDDHFLFSFQGLFLSQVFDNYLSSQMWRGKANQLKTANLCNQFLVVYLKTKKIQHERIGMERKAMVYNNAISSVKKYPLPIISIQQLKALYGIGETLCQELIKVIKHHYQAFMKERGGMLMNQGTVQIEQEREVELTQTKSVNYIKAKQELQSQFIQQDDSKSNYSFKSVTSKPYKPRPKTQGAQVLLAISKLSLGHFIAKQQLYKELKETLTSKLPPKSFHLILSNLQKSAYIQLNDQLLKITEKGQQQCQFLQQKTKEKDSSIRVKSVLNSFLSNKIDKPKSMTSQLDRLKKEELMANNESDVWLLVDTREMKDKQEQSFFEKRMEEKYRVNVKTCNLPIGDFMWQYNGQILDYVVERKKADDLISSIFDGRYKEQKYRLKNSGFGNIYYLAEGHLTGNFAKNEKQLSTALQRTRIKDQFKVVQVNNVTESTKFINFLTQKIKEQILINNKIVVLGTLEEVTLSNGKVNQLTVEHMFGLSLKTIPGVGKSAVNEVLKHFKCFRELYQKLGELGDKFERVEFLKELLKGAGVRGNLVQTLVGVLFEIN